MKKIYSYYRERLVEISGRSRSLYSKKVNKKTAYDIGRLLEGHGADSGYFLDFLFNNKRTEIKIIGKDLKERLVKNLSQSGSILSRAEEVKLLSAQASDLRTLKREVEDFAEETGRYELFLGWPFVEGGIGKDMVTRAPLLLFPVTINVENDTTVSIEKRIGEPVQLNKVFTLAYAQRYKIDVTEMITEFDSMSDANFHDVESVIKYLKTFKMKINPASRKGFLSFAKGKEPQIGDSLEIRNYAVLGKFPMANAIYNDYKLLESRKSTPAISELLESKAAKKIKKPSADLYAISTLDFSQEDAIDRLNKSGNMVVYGPPGTGKSQTIVNIITDALVKNKKVLVVSQKKAALDVVFNRLGVLNEHAMYVNEPEKDKALFYARAHQAHKAIMDNSGSSTPINYDAKYSQIQKTLSEEVALLQSISDTLFTSTPFGLTLQQIYARSASFGKTNFDRVIYKGILDRPKLKTSKYAPLGATMSNIITGHKDDLYYKWKELEQKNAVAVHILNDLDMNKINSAKSLIAKIINRRIAPFDTSKYPNSRHLFAFFLENGFEREYEFRPVVALVAKIEKKSTREISDNFTNAMRAIKAATAEYEKLSEVLDRRGYALVLDGLLNGNTVFLRMLREALDSYATIKTINLNMQTLAPIEHEILEFCHGITKNKPEFKQAVAKILPGRIYHEAVIAEESKKQELSRMLDFEGIKSKITSLKSSQKDLVRDMCVMTTKTNYVGSYNTHPDNKNFLYQIGKEKNFWTVRKLMEIYGELMLDLFPCWLLSPENVSSVMPLKEGMFDLVLFDEASQVFIENTLPTIYRSKYIAVAGDSKQLRPTALFMKRYMGGDFDEMDLNTQAALEVESLLDLATSRYTSVNLNYHYRSRHEELITFSNYVFYDRKLQIAPNLSKNTSSKPLERIKVDGKWIDRKNKAEAIEIVNLLKKIFRTRKENESIGIITFNAEQEGLIDDLIDKECQADEKFRLAIIKERSRKQNGESTGLFVKNIENVQGDERDIIIFSIGYAKGENGKVGAHFGTLNQEGGENRLNVAITRSKKKIYVVTSIEPEELTVDGTKNKGPKIFKKYLEYVRAVSSGKSKEAQSILESFAPSIVTHKDNTSHDASRELKTMLEKQGYIVEENLGSNNYKLSLAVYDKRLDKFLVGIEFDDAAFNSSSNILERDVFRSAFLKSRGWQILRIWSRDFWIDPKKVVDRIVKVAKSQQTLTPSKSPIKRISFVSK